jgi:energy-coupling factor transport system ATP-binding protein
MIRLEHVTYYYPQSKQPALRDLSFEIADGSFVAVVGANGAGKSTLCAALAGFIPHHFHGDLSGRVTVGELDTAATPLAELVTHVGLVFQNPFNQLSYSKLTVAEEVAFGLENLGVPREEMKHRVNGVLQLVGLAPLAERSPYELSGGEVQRVALASILVMAPQTLVLDEPTAQLDPIGTRQVFSAIRSIVSAQRRAVILVEQKIEWVAAFADRVIALADGAVVLDGAPREVLTSARLDEIGVSLPRYTLAARIASERGLWPRDLGLPTTLEEAIAGFRPITTSLRQAPDTEGRARRE